MNTITLSLEDPKLNERISRMSAGDRLKLSGIEIQISDIIPDKVMTGYVTDITLAGESPKEEAETPADVAPAKELAESMGGGMDY